MGSQGLWGSCCMLSARLLMKLQGVQFMHAGGHPHGVWARSGTTLNAFFLVLGGGCLLLWGTVQVVCLGAACRGLATHAVLQPSTAFGD